MKTFLCLIIAMLGHSLMAQTNSPAPAASRKLTFAVYDWEKMKPVSVTNGVRRLVFDGPTATLNELNCHITTLNPGAVSGPPRLHMQEEVTIVKEGTLEVVSDGKVETAGPGSVIFFQSHAVTQLRNPGKVPATYTVIYYYTPLTPKN
ncbi:MAG TPA: cupin domain-containing protein [Pseudomonadales bacterium]|nr:cupin domain-containing protein [Pseudomonadales bacterium]